ncbi:MAG: imidazole glycerol phosphate synthase subunit HisH [Acidobacteria bacterium]|nr:imidazole glycerol phosphate synthase subunit HisH [Acidobacteriota bacterium]
MRTTLIDSPFSNLDSIARALRHVGAELEVSADPSVLAAARRIVLPGVGSFAAAIKWLEGSGVAAALRDAVASGASLLGVCLGHQLLFEESDEMGEWKGLGFCSGRIEKFGSGVRVPKIGWNRVELTDDPLFDGIPRGASFYFVHSYRAVVVDRAQQIATAEYGGVFNAAVRNGRVTGVQFHPEKSSTAGLRLLRNYCGGA